MIKSHDYGVDVGNGFTADTPIEVLAPKVTKLDVWASFILVVFFGGLSYIALSFALFPEGKGFWASLIFTLPGVACWSFFSFMSFRDARRKYDDGFCFKFAVLSAIVVVCIMAGLFWTWLGEPSRWVGVFGTSIMLLASMKIAWENAQALSKPESVTTLPPTGASPATWDTE